eukprot:2048449-Prymnesium_polylepis.1
MALMSFVRCQRGRARGCRSSGVAHIVPHFSDVFFSWLLKLDTIDSRRGGCAVQGWGAPISPTPDTQLGS